MKQDIQDLYDMATTLYPSGINLHIANETSGTINPDQLVQSQLNGRLLLEISDATGADFLLGDALLQLILTLNGAIPQIFFQINGPNDDQTQWITQLANRAYQSVLHGITYDQLAQHHILDDVVTSGYLNNLSDDFDDDLSLVLTGLDAYLYLSASHQIQLVSRFPAALQKIIPNIEALAEPILQADLTDVRQVRRVLVQLFATLDQSYTKQRFKFQEFVTVSTVLSTRQENQSLSHLFELFHSQLTDESGNSNTYLLLNKKDRQNSFVLQITENQATPDFFKALYELSTSEFFNQHQFPYITRKASNDH